MKLQKLFERVFRRQVNRFAKAVILRNYERGIINGRQMHELTGTVDKWLWPERHGKATGTMSR